MQTAPVSPGEPPTTSTCPELNFVEPAARTRRQLEHAVGDQPGAGLGRRAVRDPDRGDAQLTAQIAARGDPVAELGGVEGDRLVGLDRDALGHAGSGVDPRGDVRGDDRRAAAVDRLDRGVGGARGAPEKPVPKIASTTAPEPASAVCDLALGVLGDRPRPPSRARFASASPESSPARQSRITSTSWPVSRRRRAATSPSPPLFPLPQTTRTGPSPARSRTASATAAARRLHQLERGHAAFLDRPGVDRAHPLGVEDAVHPGLRSPCGDNLKRVRPL